MSAVTRSEFEVVVIEFFSSGNPGGTSTPGNLAATADGVAEKVTQTAKVAAWEAWPRKLRLSLAHTRQGETGLIGVSPW